MADKLGLNLNFFGVSAKDGSGIQNAFNNLISQIFKNIEISKTQNVEKDIFTENIKHEIEKEKEVEKVEKKEIIEEKL